MFREFREFAIKGNVVDMAVGIMIGAAFSAVVKSLVDDVIMPPIGLLLGGVDFKNEFFVLRSGAAQGPYETLAQAKENGAVVIAYGAFINTIVALVLIALVLFFIVRWVNRLRRPDTPAAPTTKPCPYCRSSIDEAASRCPLCTSQL